MAAKLQVKRVTGTASHTPRDPVYSVVGLRVLEELWGFWGKITVGFHHTVDGINHNKEYTIIPIVL